MVGSTAKREMPDVDDFHSGPRNRHRLCRSVHHCPALRQHRHQPAADRLNSRIRKDIQVNGRFVLNRSEGKLMGVAAGLGDYTGVDPLLIRLGLVAALMLTGPVVILFYVLTGWLASDR